MTGRRRPPRRQGVVYGPRVTRPSSEPASVLGRVLGGIVVVGALAVLAVGALAVIGNNGSPSASPTPTRAALASPTPTVRTSATPTHASTPAPTTSASPTPSPSPFAVELVEGPGKITFASSYTSSLELIEPRVDFALDEDMAWRANIGEPVGRVEVDFAVYRLDPVTQEETLVHSSSFVGKNPDARIYYADAAVNREVDGAGIFVMRYSVDGETISEGYFRVSE